ncbi:MAG: hypothetical protein ACYCU0_08320 [Solirubrobacteraceae bacterium]
MVAPSCVQAGRNGMLLIAPEWPSENTRAAVIMQRAGAQPLSPEEFEAHFGHLPTDGEG